MSGTLTVGVPVVLGARPRAALFVGVGYGFHSMMNVIVNFVPEGFVRNAVYLVALLFIGCVDLWFLSRWYPPIRAILRKLLPQSARERISQPQCSRDTIRAAQASLHTGAA